LYDKSIIHKLGPKVLSLNGNSYRECQAILAERGVSVDHSAVYRWDQRYSPETESDWRTLFTGQSGRQSGPEMTS
jgi:transposase-like protein